MSHLARAGRRADLGNRYFRSSWESNVARYLNWLQANGEIQKWDYEDKEWFFPLKRGNRSYKCDFHVWNKDDSEEFWEVKGYMSPSSATKLKRMAKYYPEVKIILIDKDAYQALTKQLKPILIDTWE